MWANRRAPLLPKMLPALRPQHQRSGDRPGADQRAVPWPSAAPAVAFAGGAPVGIRPQRRAGGVPGAARRRRPTGAALLVKPLHDGSAGENLHIPMHTDFPQFPLLLQQGRVLGMDVPFHTALPVNFLLLQPRSDSSSGSAGGCGSLVDASLSQIPFFCRKLLALCLIQPSLAAVAIARLLRDPAVGPLPAPDRYRTMNGVLLKVQDTLLLADALSHIPPGSPTTAVFFL